MQKKSVGILPTVLVTGADGFIGSHLTEKLVLKGYKVKALVQYNSFNSWGWLDSVNEEIISNVEVIQGDVRDPYSTNRSFSNCDAAVHLAALIAIPYSYLAPESYIDTNVKGTLNVLEAAKTQNLKRLIHISTSEVYGTAISVPINETHPLQGQSPYSASKIAADQLAFSYYSSFELPVLTVRPFNTYGPRQSARAVIPSIISQILKGNPSLQVGAVNPTRDFSFVDDTVSGIIAALEGEGGFGEVFNLGSNFEVSISETINILKEIMSSDIEIVPNDLRLRPSKSEVERLWADNSKAINKFGWEPRYANEFGFRSGLEKTVHWFTNPENLARYKSGIYNV